MDDFKEFYLQKPLFTRTYITLAIFVSILLRVSPTFLTYILLTDQVYRSFQIWRLFTHFFLLGALNFNLLFVLYFMFNPMRYCEGLFEGSNYPDFCYMILFLMLAGNLIAFIGNFYFMSFAFLFSLIYIWCKRRPFETVQFYFGFRIKSSYFPFILMAFHLLIEQDIYQDIMGLLMGQTYLILKDYLPVTHGYRFIETPKFFINLANKYIVPYAPWYKERRPQEGQQQQWRVFAGPGQRIG